MKPAIAEDAKRKEAENTHSEWRCRSVKLYERVTLVGRGTFGSVFKARIRPEYSLVGNEEFVALKQINQKEEKEGFPITALREIRLLSKLRHKNIVDLIEIVTSKRNRNLGKVYLVFEYMEHDLLGIIKKQTKLDISQIKCIVKQILEGIEFLHSKNVIHRDIKCANILMNNSGDIKLADFGLARLMERKDKNYTNKVVTLWYRSPELLLGSTNYTAAVDMWSVGCCFAELLRYTPLFQADSEPKVLDIIYKKCGAPTEESWPGVTSLKYYKDFAPKDRYPRRIYEEFKDNLKVDTLALDLLDKLLILDPNRRISAKEALDHEYFKVHPLPCAPTELPKLPNDIHDYQLKHPQQIEKRQPIKPAMNTINLNYYCKIKPEAAKRGLSKKEERATEHLEPAKHITKHY